MVDMSIREVKDVLLRFLHGPTRPWEWDDFISAPIKDPYLNAVRIICQELPMLYPPEPSSGFYCSDEGWRVLHVIESDLLPVRGCRP